MKFFDQNGIKAKAIGYQDKPFSGYVCILRPKNQEALGLNDNTARFQVEEVYTTQVDLKVRDGAGTDKRWKLREELTEDGQRHAANSNNAVLKAGTKVTCKEIKEIGNDLWIRMPSGWIAAVYNGNVYVK